MVEGGNIVSKGPTTAFTLDVLNVARQAGAEADNQNNSEDTNTDGKPEGQSEAGANTNDSHSGSDAKPQFDETALKEYFKAQGITYDGTIEELKAKLQPAGTQPSEAEIKAKDEAIERRMLQIHLDSGGKVEDFAAVKKMLTADVAEVSKAQLHQELLAQGFDEEEAKAMSKQMFLQEDLENIERDVDNDETEEEFQKRKAKLESKVKYGADKLANRSLHIKTTAEQIWNDLKQQVEQQDIDLGREAKFSADVDEIAKSLPKSVSLAIGQIDGKDVEPVVYSVPENVHQEVASFLKDKAKREEYFFDANGNLNLQNITDVLVRNKILEGAARETYVKGQTAQVKLFQKQFPSKSAADIGVGGANPKPNSKDVGQPVSRGTTTKFQPTLKP